MLLGAVVGRAGWPWIIRVGVGGEASGRGMVPRVRSESCWKRRGFVCLDRWPMRLLVCLRFLRLGDMAARQRLSMCGGWHG